MTQSSPAAADDDYDSDKKEIYFWEVLLFSFFCLETSTRLRRRSRELPLPTPTTTARAAAATAVPWFARFFSFFRLDLFDFDWTSTKSSVAAADACSGRAFFFLFWLETSTRHRRRSREQPPPPTTTTLRAAIVLVGKSCFRRADADNIEKSRCRSLFVACLFVTGEVIDAKANDGERDDYFARCHFLDGKSRSRAPRPTTLKRGVGICLLRFLLLQERSSMPTSEKEKTRRRL